MTNIHTEQLLRVLLSQAHAAREAERDQRLRTEQRAIQARTLQFEMAQRLLPKELDDLWKNTDINIMPDDQFSHWMTSQLNAQLFDYHALRSDRVAEQLAQLQTAVRWSCGYALNSRHSTLCETYIMRMGCLPASLKLTRHLSPRPRKPTRHRSQFQTIRS